MSTIFFALLAFYIFFKLSKQLGKIDEEEKKQIEEKIIQMRTAQQKIVEQMKQQEAAQEKIVGGKSTEEVNPIEEKILASLDEATKQNLLSILARCNMTAEFFVSGAKSAFEMVIKSFASGDLQTLKFLLSDKIFSGFEAAIIERKTAEKTLTTNLISIEKSEIISAMMLENIASIVVKFVSKQINYISGKDGQVLEGRKDEISEITDVWTFKRDVTSSNPNWTVAATNSN